MGEKKKSCESNEEGITTPLRGRAVEVETGERARSQALFGQGGGDLVSQRGELRRVGHVDATRGGHGAQLVGGVFQRDDLGTVVGAGLGRLTEVQLVALNPFLSASRNVADVIQRADFGLDFKLQLLVFDLNIPTTRLVMNVGLRSTLGSNVAQIDLFVHDLDLASARCVL